MTGLMKLILTPYLFFLYSHDMIFPIQPSIRHFMQLTIAIVELK